MVVDHYWKPMSLKHHQMNIKQREDSHTFTSGRCWVTTQHSGMFVFSQPTRLRWKSVFQLVVYFNQHAVDPVLLSFCSKLYTELYSSILIHSRPTNPLIINKHSVKLLRHCYPALAGKINLRTGDPTPGERSVFYSILTQSL